MCYPQQLGRSWKDFVPEPFGTLSAMCNGHLTNSVCYLHQNHPELHRLLNQNLPEPHQLSAPKQSGSLSAFCHYAIELSTNLACYLHRNPPNLISHPEPSRTLSTPHRSKPHQPFAPEPSGTSSAICTGTLRNFISHLHRNPPEFHQPSAPEPSGTSSATGTLQNFISHLHRNPPEPCLLSAPEPAGTLSAICTGRNSLELHQLSPPEPSGTSSSAPEPSGTSSAICPGKLRKVISHLHRNPPEPSGTLRNPPEPSGTLRNLLRNLVLQLHRIAPELFWAKDPIASFAVGEKNKLWGYPQQQFLMPRLTTWAPFFFLSGFAHVDNVITKRGLKQSYGCSCQDCNATNHTISLRNLPNPASGTYTSTHRNLPELSGTKPTPAHTGALQNLLH